MSRDYVGLIIDAQNDFVKPDGALPVAGAVGDMERLSKFIQNNSKQFRDWYATLDSHQIYDISHPIWWKDKNGNNVPPFTMITSADINNGVYTPAIHPQWSINYIKELEAQGEFNHMVWTEHCLIGTEGHNIYKPLMETLMAWEREFTTQVRYVTKGSNPYTEHFGAFRANIVMPKDLTTAFNQPLLTQLTNSAGVFLAGEARSHCVANTLKQLMEEAPSLMNKLIILEDCMSDVPNLPQSFYDSVQTNIYDKAKSLGVRFVKHDIIL